MPAALVSSLRGESRASAFTSPCMPPVSVRIAGAPAANPGRVHVMGQAEAASKTLRYDPYLRRAFAELARNLHCRNYEYRIVSDGGIVDRELDTLITWSLSANPSMISNNSAACSSLAWKSKRTSATLSSTFRTTRNCLASDSSNSHVTNRAPATLATSATGNCCSPTAAPFCTWKLAAPPVSRCSPAAGWWRW